MESEEQERKYKQLNKKQRATLKLMYQFRFVTSEMLAQAEGQRYLQVTRSRLTILAEQGYIGRRYDSSYKLRGKYASYYLLPKGIQALKAHMDSSPRAIKMLYNDRTATEAFVEHSRLLFTLSQELTSLYGDGAAAFTHTELAEYDYFPKPAPDLYLTTPDSHYFIDLYRIGQPLFSLTRKMKRYIHYQERGEWEQTGSGFPGIVVACETKVLEAKVRDTLAPLADSTRGRLTFFTVSLSSDPDSHMTEDMLRPL